MESLESFERFKISFNNVLFDGFAVQNDELLEMMKRDSVFTFLEASVNVRVQLKVGVLKVLQLIKNRISNETNSVSVKRDYFDVWCEVEEVVRKGSYSIAG